MNYPPASATPASAALWRYGSISRLNADTMTIVLDPPAGSPGGQCGSCRKGGGCGAGLFAALFASRHAEFELPRQAGYCDGDRVELAIASSVALKMAFVAYCLPVLLMLLFAMICQYYVTTHAVYTVLSGIAGLIAGLVGGLIAYPGVPGYSAAGSVSTLQLRRIGHELREFTVN